MDRQREGPRVCTCLSDFDPDSWIWGTLIHNCHPAAGVMAAMGTWAPAERSEGPRDDWRGGGGGGAVLRAYGRLTLSSLSVPAQARPSSQTWTPLMPPAPLAPPPPASPMTPGKLPGSLDSHSDLPPPYPVPPPPACCHVAHSVHLRGLAFCSCEPGAETRWLSGLSGGSTLIAGWHFSLGGSSSGSFDQRFFLWGLGLCMPGGCMSLPLTARSRS